MSDRILPALAVAFIGTCLFLAITLTHPWLNAFIPVS